MSMKNKQNDIKIILQLNPLMYFEDNIQVKKNSK